MGGVSEQFIYRLGYCWAGYIWQIFELIRLERLVSVRLASWIQVCGIRWMVSRHVFNLCNPTASLESSRYVGMSCRRRCQWEIYRSLQKRLRLGGGPFSSPPLQSPASSVNLGFYGHNLPIFWLDECHHQVITMWLSMMASEGWLWTPTSSQFSARCRLPRSPKLRITTVDTILICIRRLQH